MMQILKEIFLILLTMTGAFLFKRWGRAGPPSDYSNGIVRAAYVIVPPSILQLRSVILIKCMQIASVASNVNHSYSPVPMVGISEINNTEIATPARMCRRLGSLTFIPAVTLPDLRVLCGNLYRSTAIV
jgi:hypothetical protein